MGYGWECYLSAIWKDTGVMLESLAQRSIDWLIENTMSINQIRSQFSQPRIWDISRHPRKHQQINRNSQSQYLPLRPQKTPKTTLHKRTKGLISAKLWFNSKKSGYNYLQMQSTWTVIPPPKIRNSQPRKGLLLRKLQFPHRTVHPTINPPFPTTVKELKGHT